jgi:hypothetical protein
MDEQGTAVATIELDDESRRDLRDALNRLDQGRGVIVRLADLIGGAVGLAGRFGIRRMGVSRALQGKVSGIAEAALARAYDVAILGLEREPPQRAERTRTAVIASGAASGFAGLAGFLPDATFVTLAIMREIARIAAEQGENLADEDTRRACLEVFAFRSEADADESELGYFSARLVFQGRPFTLLLSEVAARYGLVLGEKFAAQIVPVVGAVAGAALNAAFLAHYRNLAIAHFTIRRLERRHGQEAVRAARALAAPAHADAAFAGA